MEQNPATIMPSIFGRVSRPCTQSGGLGAQEVRIKNEH